MDTRNLWAISEFFRIFSEFFLTFAFQHMTPVEVALCYGNVEVAKILVEQGGIHHMINAALEDDEEDYKGR